MTIHVDRNEMRHQNNHFCRKYINFQEERCENVKMEITKIPIHIHILYLNG